MVIKEPPPLRVERLTKIYPSADKPAVDEISFQLGEGEILGLLGPNGSGKTTTIQMLLGTLSCTFGSIVYFGKDFSLHRSKILAKLSYASSYASMPGLLKVRENLEICGLLYGYTRKESAQLFTPLLERFGIFELRESAVSTLSAGQVTRLMLVKAFFTQPSIVLLDEPTASLDPDIAKDVCSFLVEQREEKQLSILFTSHKMEEVMEVCDRTIFLKEGRIIADDTPKKIARSVSSFRLQLLIVEGLERAILLAQRHGYRYTIDHRFFLISIEEEQIAPFLQTITEEGIIYTNIKIDEPSLDEFFLHITKKSP